MSLCLSPSIDSTALEKQRAAEIHAKLIGLNALWMKEVDAEYNANQTAWVKKLCASNGIIVLGMNEPL